MLHYGIVDSIYSYKNFGKFLCVFVRDAEGAMPKFLRRQRRSKITLSYEESHYVQKSCSLKCDTIIHSSTCCQSAISVRLEARTFMYPYSH